MLAEGAGEYVVARVVGAGAEVKVAVPLVAQYRIDGCDAWGTDGPWRYASVAVCVIGRIDLKVAIKHPPEGEIANGELYGRISL